MQHLNCENHRIIELKISAALKAETWRPTKILRLLLLWLSGNPGIIKTQKLLQPKNVFQFSNSQSFSLACFIQTEGSHLPVARLRALYSGCFLHPSAKMVRSSILRCLVSIGSIPAQKHGKKGLAKAAVSFREKT